MLIDVDHLSERARERVLEIADAHDYPLVSSHTDTGGLWTPRELRRLYRLGGIATARPAQAPALAQAIDGLRQYRSRSPTSASRSAPTPAASAELPGPRADAAQRPLAYPFSSYDGEVSFDRQVTGERTFDLNTDGVAHYGLFADLLADLQRTPGGERRCARCSAPPRPICEMWERAHGSGR